jgi:hypothetical protein
MSSPITILNVVFQIINGLNKLVTKLSTFLRNRELKKKYKKGKKHANRGEVDEINKILR